MIKIVGYEVVHHCYMGLGSPFQISLITFLMVSIQMSRVRSIPVSIYRVTWHVTRPYYDPRIFEQVWFWRVGWFHPIRIQRTQSFNFN